MSDSNPTAAALEERLMRAEAALAVRSRSDVDLFVGSQEPLVERLKSLVEEKERQDHLLDALIETSPALILLTDSQGRIVRFNGACEEITGYSRNEVLGKTIPELFRAPGWENISPARPARSSDSTLSFPNHGTWLTKTGEQRQIDWRCVAVSSPEGGGHYVWGIGLDITLRKLAQVAAAEARAFAESIIATVREPLLVLDDNLRVKAANPAFYQTFQVKPAETIERPLYELGSLQWDSPALRRMLGTILPQNTSFDNFEIDYDFPRIGRRIMLLNGRRVVREKGSKAMILLAIEDVTEKVQARVALHEINRELEDRVRKRTAELNVANKELEAFCYSVSHDLRAPLRAIDGFSQELLNSYADRVDEQGTHYLRRIRAGTQRMGQLIDDLLELSQVTRAEIRRKPVDLTALAHIVAAELRERSPERTISFTAQPGLTAECDPRLIRIVLENLLGNAWKYSAKKLSATVEFARTEAKGQQAFVVRDDGAGFDMAYAGKLFGVFQRLHSDREFAGTGIGLATVQRIIHRHGGEVWADGAVGRGAAFYFTIPYK